jgi:phenylacetate-CoA ligase
MLANLELPHEPTQRDRLTRMLPRWLELPIYRSRLAQAGMALPVAGMALDWQRLPFVSKREMREGFPGNFLPPDQALETLLERAEVEVEHTSGTSEERVPVLLGRGWWEAQEARALRLNSFVSSTLDKHPGARRAVLTTPTCNGMVCHSKWMPRAQRTVGQSLYVNQARIPFTLTEPDLARMAEEILDWQPLFLDLDPVHGVWFARYCERQGLSFPSLRFVLASYEFVSVVHRRILERVWRVPLFNLYGSTETGHLVMQDEAGAMRPCLENAFLELVETDASGVGQLVVTTLTNEFMPLLRYRIGDLIAREGPGGTAACVIHGRARDALQRADGTRITTWQVDRCFQDIAGLTHYQLRQAENGECLLRLLPDGAGLTKSEEKELLGRLERLLGAPGAITTESVEVLLPTPSGKFRLTHRQ